MFLNFWKSRPNKVSVAKDNTQEQDGEENDEIDAVANGHAKYSPPSSLIPNGGTIVATSSKSESLHGRLSRCESPPKSEKIHTPRTPRSESAIQDGRRYLSAYRQSKENGKLVGSKSAQNKRRTRRVVARCGIEYLDVPPGLVDDFSKRVERYHSCAPSLARNLEAALTASLSKHTAQDSSGRCNVHSRAEREDANGASSTAPEGATIRPFPRSGSNSPGRPTPETLRHAAQNSQADYLSSVLPVQYAESGSGEWSDAYPMLSTSERQSSWTRGEQGHRTPQRDPGSSESAEKSATMDRAAVERWEALRRFQQQSLGLGTAAESQLGRALELCRDLQGWKDLPRTSGTLGNQRAAQLDALKSSLHGLEEIVSKKREIDRSVQEEACALGGPVIIGALLDSGGPRERAVSDGIGRALGVADENGGGASAETQSEAGAEGLGWISTGQLKAFEEEVRARSSLEIAALESERRKLKGKVDMFQRQLHFLQRGDAADGAAEAAAVPPVNSNERGRNGEFVSDELARSRLIAGLLDARLGGDKQLQTSLEVEVNTLRDSIEEKDGLIDALRQALRAAAADQHTANGGEPRLETRRYISTRVEESTYSRSVPGIPRSDRRINGRLHSSRLLHPRGQLTAPGVEEATATSAGMGSMAPLATMEEDKSGEDQAIQLDHARANLNSGTAEVAHDDAQPESETEPVASPATGSTAATASLQDLRRHSDSNVDNGPASSGTTNETNSSTNNLSTSTSTNEGGRSRSSRGEGLVSLATAIPGAALRTVWNSARAVGSTVGTRGRGSSGTPQVQRRDHGSSHAVFIL